MCAGNTNNTMQATIQGIYTIVSKNVAYLIFYNLNKPDPIFIIFRMQYPDNPNF